MLWVIIIHTLYRYTYWLLLNYFRILFWIISILQEYSVNVEPFGSFLNHSLFSVIDFNVGFTDGRQLFQMRELNVGFLIRLATPEY
jgi:hypothetical protein